VTDGSAFRGIQGIREAKARLAKLAAWYKRFKPEVTELVCSRKDYDLIARWPKAANVEQFLVSASGIYFEGFRLTYDTGQGRYDKRADPEQTVIT
jgi:hypothetical protein